ncbi:LysR family transcriptional regulator [Methylovorus sp. MM2]|uniref:LysR family transcriptional regulator n=1 Tax=Methylovorus sp. MM2 TaxID=1848038 RepID=UPI0007E1D9FE|nr:LysR family transcriptional regulator [Methylovorus sp. MM2]OAM52561.1 LysR family transcriptional regulator [Methylovorus sp. MM2]
MKITTDELQAFVAIADVGSITRAADYLDQTTSGVSRALSRLEEKLGVTLLHRTTRRLNLTEEGRVFLVQAREIIQSIDSAEESMMLRWQRPAGVLRVNTATPFMVHCVIPHMRDFRDLYPDIQLELDTDDLVIDLLERRTDIAIRIGPLEDSTLHARSLGKSKLRLLASPNYLARYGIPATIDDFSRHTLLGFTEPASLNNWPLIGASGNQHKIVPNIAASSGESLRELALCDLGIVCLSNFMTHQDVAGGRLVPILEAHTAEHFQPVHAVYYQNTRLSARISCFLNFLQSVIQL